MIPPNYGIEYAQGFHDMYGDIAARLKVKLVPFLLEGFADKPGYFQADQMHPTAAAQPLIADTVWKVLGPVLRKRTP
jgi:acyl-CoA thioesterase-1